MLAHRFPSHANLTIFPVRVDMLAWINPHEQHYILGTFMPNCAGDTSSCKEQKRVVCCQVTQEPQTSSTAKELDTPTLWRASLDSDPAAWDPIAALTQECPRGMTSTTSISVYHCISIIPSQEHELKMATSIKKI